MGEGLFRRRGGGGGGTEKGGEVSDRSEKGRKGEKGAYRIILSISIPPPQQPNHRTGNDVGRMMPIIHGSRDCDEGRAGEGGKEEP